MSNTDRWKPAPNKNYWHVTRAGEVRYLCWYNDPYDKALYTIGNCFETEKEAEEAAEALKRFFSEYHANKNLNRSSLYISETAKLPDWCKQNEWIFDYNEREYAQVKDIFGDIAAVALTYAGTKEQVTKSWKYIADCCCQAQLHPYSAKEMFKLLGKTLSNGTRSEIVTAHEEEFVHMSNGWYKADDLIDYSYTLDNRPCGVLEHFENGKWVKNEH